MIETMNPENRAEIPEFLKKHFPKSILVRPHKIKKKNSSINYSTTPGFSSLLQKIGGTILISSYQSNKVITFSSECGKEINIDYIDVNTPMGIGCDDNKIAIASKLDITIYNSSKRLDKTHPNPNNRNKKTFVPQVTYHTGDVNMHDLHFGDGKLWAVNTDYSYICTIDSKNTFNPIWKPHFVDKMDYDDYCHLNGIAMQNGKPEYVTSLGRGNSKNGWRKTAPHGGLLMHVPSNEVILESLCVPHSPTLHNGKLYLLQSGKGSLEVVDPKSKTYETIVVLDGFARGMVFSGDYAIIGTSRKRESSKAAKKLKIVTNNESTGISIVNLKSGKVEGKLSLLDIQELYDVKLLKDAFNVRLLGPQTPDDQYYPMHTPNQKHWRSYMGKMIETYTENNEKKTKVSHF